MSFSVAPFDSARHHDQVVALWHAVFGYADARNDPGLTIAKKTAARDGLFFVATAKEDAVIGTVMAGYDGHRGWIYSLAVLPNHRGQGIGAQLLRTAEEALTRRGCLKINLQILPDNESVARFYESSGYGREARISMGKEIPENIRPDAIPDAELLRRFLDCSYPFDRWDHRTHVKLAFLFLREHAFEAALERYRAGIRAYNAAHRVPETQFSGYNETTTHAFLHLVHVTMQAYGGIFPTPDADSFCDTHPQLLSKHLLRLFYSPEARGLPAAKDAFLEPDLTALPQTGGGLTSRGQHA